MRGRWSTAIRRSRSRATSSMATSGTGTRGSATRACPLRNSPTPARKRSRSAARLGWRGRCSRRPATFRCGCRREGAGGVLGALEQHVCADRREESGATEQPARLRVQLRQAEAYLSAGKFAANVLKREYGGAVDRRDRLGIEDEPSRCGRQPRDHPANAAADIVAVEEHQRTLNEIDREPRHGFCARLVVQFVEAALSGNAAE